jgi:release factor glutamine methyltransferase
MNIGKALVWGEDELRQLDCSKLEAEVLLSKVLKRDRVFLKTNLQYPLNWREKRLYKKCVQRRLQGIPLAYIFGHKHWGGMFLDVNNHVLIPRDETETLCERICTLPRENTPQCILDVGTGSGNIALFLKKHFLDADVWAIDISAKALKVAQKNAQKQDLLINFLQSDLLQGIEGIQKYDIIVANLPYVPQQMKVSEEVRREPRRAVFSGEDGLDTLRLFVDQLFKKDIHFTELWLEFLPLQKESIQQLFSNNTIEFLPDEGGDIRFAKIINQNVEY